MHVYAGISSQLFLVATVPIHRPYIPVAAGLGCVDDSAIRRVAGTFIRTGSEGDLPGQVGLPVGRNPYIRKQLGLYCDNGPGVCRETYAAIYFRVTGQSSRNYIADLLDEKHMKLMLFEVTVT